MKSVAVEGHKQVAGLAQSAKTVVVVGVFSVVLQFVYKTKVSPNFAYAGLTYRDPVPIEYATAIFAAIVVALVLPSHIRRASDFVLWVLFIVAAAPSILLAQYMATLPPAEATKMGVSVAGCMILARVATAAGPRDFVPRLSIEPAKFWPLLAVVCVAIYVYLILFVGVHLRYLTFSEVYDTRADFKASSLGIPLIGYLLPAVYNAINPVFIARGIYARSSKFIAAGAAGQALIYVTTGQKSVILSTFALFGIAFLFRNRETITAVRLVLATTALALGALAIDAWTGGITWTSLFARRFLVIPGALTAAYVSVFAHQPRMHFSDSMLPFLDNPFTTKPALIVGAQFFGNGESNANVNLFGHGYLNYGYLGMFVEASVLVILLWVVNDVTRHLPLRAASLIFLMPAISLSNASVFTSILTSGFLAAIVICAAMPADGWRREVSSPVTAAT